MGTASLLLSDGITPLKSDLSPDTTCRFRPFGVGEQGGEHIAQ